MKNPKETMQELINKYDKKGNYATLIYGKKIELAISIYENELEFIINLEKYHCLGCKDMLKRISQLKEALEIGKRSLK